MKSKKCLVSFGLAVLLIIAFILPGCAGVATDNNADEVVVRQQDPEYRLKMQHSWGAAENHFYEEYARAVEAMSGGRIVIEVFSEGELVDYDEIPDAVSSGLLDIGHTHPSYNIGLLDEGYLEYVPFLWRNTDELMAALWHYGIADLTKEAIEEAFDVVVLDFQIADPAGLLFSKPVYSINDMAGMTVNIEPPLAYMLEDLVGIKAIYYDAEDLWYNVQMGIIDGLEYGGFKAMSDMDLHTAAVGGGVSGQGSFVLPYFVIGWYPYYCINPSLWEELPQDLQAILIEATHANTVWMRSYYAYHEIQSKTIMQEAGIGITNLPEDEVELIFEKTLEWLENDFAPKSPRTQKLYEAVMEALKDFGRI